MDHFESNPWSIVVEASLRISPEARQALPQLCRKNWLTP